jgi:hypothetical protein
MGRKGWTDRTGPAHSTLVLPGLILAVIVLAGSGAHAQCAMCRTLLQTPEGKQMAAAFRSGILLLLAAPFSIFGVIAALAVKTQRRRHASAAGNAADI